MFAPQAFAGRQITCPSCSATTTVPSVTAKRQSRSNTSIKLLAGAVFLGGILGTGYWLGKRGAAPSGGHDSFESSAAATNQVASSETGPGLSSGGSTEPRDAAGPASGSAVHPSAERSESSDELARSGATDWEAAEAYYTKVGAAQPLSLTSQPAKGSAYTLTMPFDIDQVGPDFILVRNRVTKGRWLLIPDDPKALGEKIPSGFVYQAVGRYEGAKVIQLTSGASESVPVLRTFAVSTSFGFINLEDPAARHASPNILSDLAAERKTQIEEEKAQHYAAANKATQAAEASAKQEQEGRDRERQRKADEQRAVASRQLSKARSDLDTVNATIDASRQRYQDALAVINTLTKNKTVPVTEGSSNYYKCLAASKVVNQVEEAAPALKAEKARLQSLVADLEAQTSQPAK